MYTVKATRSLVTPVATLGSVLNLTGDGLDSREVVIAASATTEVAIAFLRTNLKAIALKAVTTDLTVGTNNSGSPVDEFDLTAGVPRIWTYQDPDTESPFQNGDVTKFYVVNGGAETVLEIAVLVDSTP